MQESLERQRDTQTEVNEHLKKELELQQEIIEKRREQLQSEIDLADAHMDYINASGGVVTAGYYEEQIRLSKEISDSYEEQIENLKEQQSLVDKNSAEYYSLEAKIVECESSIIDCKKEQAEWNEAIKRLPVERMEKYINMLKAIKQELEDYLDYQETIGQTTTKDQYQQLMEINQTQIDKLQEQAAELQNLLNDYQYGSDKFNEVAEELSDIQNETANLVNEMQEYNNAILNIPIEKLESANEELERYANTLTGIMDDYDSVLSAVTDSIENETNALEDLKQQTEDTYETQISALKQQSELLDKQNEKKQKELAVEQSLYDLEKARNQKTTKVIREGKEVYETNIDDMRDAEQSYQDALLEKKKYELSSEVERLEEERDALLEGYDDEIERLNKISEKWQKISEDAAKYADALKADEILGADWQEKVLLGNDEELYQMFKNLYDTTNQSKVQVDEQIASNERIAEMMKVFVERFTDGSITYEQALKGISELATSMDNGYSSLEQLSGFMNLDGIEHITDIADSMKSQADESITMLEEYMEIAKINHDAIADYTSTWEEMSKLIEEQLASLKAAAEALEEWVKEQKYHGYSSDGDNDSSNIDYTDHKSSGTITTSADGRGYDNPDYKDERTYHKGIENGLIGNTDSSRAEILKHIATEDLKPDETYFKGLIGEAIFTKEQQEQLIENYNKLGYSVGMFTPTPKAIDATKYIKSENKTYGDVNVTFGDIKLEGVQNPDEFAKAVKNQFGGIVRQEVSKAKYRNW